MMSHCRLPLKPVQAKVQGHGIQHIWIRSSREIFSFYSKDTWRWWRWQPLKTLYYLFVKDIPSSPIFEDVSPHRLLVSMSVFLMATMGSDLLWRLWGGWKTCHIPVLRWDHAHSPSSECCLVCTGNAEVGLGSGELNSVPQRGQYLQTELAKANNLLSKSWASSPDF